MLITTIAQFRTASSINVSNTIDTWLPYISEAEEMFLIPVISQKLYDALLAFSIELSSKYPDEISAGEEGEPLSDEQILWLNLLLKARKAVALYALYLGIDEISVSISSSGITVIQSETHKPAPQYQIMNLKESYLTRAHRQVDLILAYLSRNKTRIPEFMAPGFDLFFRSADEFQLYADIHASRRVFLSLVPIISGIEKKYILPTLSPAFFADLKLKYLSDTLSVDELVVLSLVQQALSHLSIARALLEISIDFLDWGIFNNSINTFNSVSTKALVNSEKIAMMHKANQTDGESELKMLQEFLDSNASATKYALYFASSRYAGKENAVKRAEFTNTSTNSIFVV
jgi:hypothetical protein